MFAQKGSGPLQGIYEGSLALPGGAKLRLVFHLDGKGSGTWDSPDQGAKGLKLSAVTVKKDAVTLTSATPPWTFTGKLSADKKTVVGTFAQGPGSFPLTVKKVTQPTELRRPQTPKPPFPYKTIEVTLPNNAEAGVTLGGTLALPQGTGPFPCAVFITGSGQEDRDETLFGHKPFAVIADYLARRGIASLRCDDRMVGNSKGEVRKATSANFATDVEAQLAFLKTRPEVNSKKLGLIGHSEGGLIAPMVAAKPENEVAFAVLLAGPGVPGDQVLSEQTYAGTKAIAGEAAAAAARAQTEKLLPIVKTEPDPQKALEAMAKALGAPGADALPAEAKAELLQLTSPWMRYFLTYDPAPALAKTTCPVLALNGEKDLQVLIKQNLPVIEKTLKGAGNKDVTAVGLPNLNHLFQHGKTGSGTEYAAIEETFAPEALKLIGDWIVARTKK